MRGQVDRIVRLGAALLAVTMSGRAAATTLFAGVRADEAAGEPVAAAPNDALPALLAVLGPFVSVEEVPPVYGPKGLVKAAPYLAECGELQPELCELVCALRVRAEGAVGGTVGRVDEEPSLALRFGLVRTVHVVEVVLAPGVTADRHLTAMILATSAGPPSRCVCHGSRVGVVAGS